jgi:hypothetical protein
MIEFLRHIGYLFCFYIDDIVDEFNDFNFTETDF